MDQSPDDEDFQGRLLHQAALWDNVDLLTSLLTAGADVNAIDSAGRRALHAAVLHNDSACLGALIAHGADVNASSGEASGRQTALHLCAARGHTANVGALLAAGADIEATDVAGDSPLVVAARNGHRHVVRMLRDAQDALERDRLSKHAALRELVSAGDADGLHAAVSALGASAGIIVNMTPGGANTLLYLACESGSTPLVQTLLSAGADARAHAVTRYTPLHGACSSGHREVARLLLQYCPTGVKQVSVEQWLPLHAAVIGGHVTLVTLLLGYSYPQDVLDYYTDSTGQWRYLAAFDVNAVDASGQSALYVASALGNLPVVDALLSYSVVAERVNKDEEVISPAAPSPVRSGIALGIHAIVSKLAGHHNNEPAPPTIHPVRTDFHRNGDSCLGAAARGQHLSTVKRLLQAGADANAPAAPPQAKAPSSRGRRSRSACPVASRSSASPQRYPDDDNSGPWTALAWSVHNKNTAIGDLLLAAGAKDPHNVALALAARHQLTHIASALIANKAYIDPEYKLNKAALSEAVFTSAHTDSTLTYSALCPTAPVALAWRELGCQLATVRMSWLRSAALRVNPKLSNSSVALNAITRIDVSNNELRELPPELFTLLSLRYLNAAQNKLERLPSLSDPFEDELDSKGRKIKRLLRKSRPPGYSAPVLHELYLQDNRLEELPPAVFTLPSLTTLDVSNNKLRHLPAAMWRAPKLAELSAQLNHLKDLPTLQSETASTPKQQPSPSSASSVSSQFSFPSQSQSSSRSPSIDCSESESTDDVIVRVADRNAHAVTTEPKRVHTWRGVEPADPPQTTAEHSRLTTLNLAHNQFTRVPPPLACLAPQLQQLNMSYNALRSMSFVTSYPTSLRQLDLSHNEITCWPSLPQLETFTSGDDPLACYCPVSTARPRPRSVTGPITGSMRTQLMSAACSARRHFTLEGLRTLILANNLLTRIQLTTDDDGHRIDKRQPSEEGDEWESDAPPKSRLVFPLLSMLDISCNLLRSVPPAIHELTNLAVLNIGGNKEITDLPPQMGLLSRLWNLNTAGCNLSEPLASMVSNGRYRSMDVIGYLKSVLQEAHEYRRMKLMVVGSQGIGKTSLLECLRQESALHHRRKPTDHWAKRMGNKASRKNMSTVGVDIGQWVYEKSRNGRGPVTFRTWDFGGQQEYYATHQYFLSRRSLYLVVWRATDGASGLAAAIGWLRSIQARAPGSPVIMVVTHIDQWSSSNLPECESPEALQRIIRTYIIGAGDADKIGLPRVMDSIEVSCVTRHNIRLLADVIYTVAFSVKPPGSKEPLLEQRVPATYIALEEVISILASELSEPVLKHDDYKRLVTQYMQQKCHKSFRDASELQQATMFLHENGVLLHYEDATLKELYFVRPQWLCDVLAMVVTVREINPFAAAGAGIMRAEELALVLKGSPALAREDAAQHTAALLNKFELALCWDARLLLIPPLLPPNEPIDSTPQLLLRSRTGGGWSTRAYSPNISAECPIEISSRCGAPPLRRLLLLSYVPCGFWARLVTRVLADSALACSEHVYNITSEMEVEDSVSKALDLNWGWQLWKTGLKLVCGDITLLSVRELPASRDPLLGAIGDYEESEATPYSNVRLRVLQDGAWSTIDVAACACVEICLPASVCVLRRRDRQPMGRYQSISLDPNPEMLAKLLAILSDHVDLLLEDWYPALGTRFVHTSSGRCLITRVVPCPPCLRESTAHTPPPRHDGLVQAFDRLELAAERRQRLSSESRASDGDSGVGHESNASSRLGSVEGPPYSGRLVTAWTVEQCILAGCQGGGPTVACHCHPPQRLQDIAPDTMFLDVPESHRARWEHITRGRIVGRGAFGTVLGGVWGKGGRQVAVKALQPVPPPHKADVSETHAYKAAVSRWDRDPAGSACRAYCALRQELGILWRLNHPHVVSVMAVCGAPLALLLELAPMGALDGALRSYRRLGARLAVGVCRAVALQVARALEYLHARRVVYRDLKSENVLVWQLPLPGDANTTNGPVKVKLGDYGISRLAPPAGTKGFGGTEGFMAPEIMRHNGEQEYNEKVDCFSYGMLLYELMTLRLPFEGHEGVKECMLDGGRPHLTPTDLQYPCPLLSIMKRCWSSQPSCRPSAAALVAMVTAPECGALHDVVHCVEASRATTASVCLDEDTRGFEIWLSSDCRIQTLQGTPHQFTQQHSIRTTSSSRITALCTVQGSVWAGDEQARVTVYDIATCQHQWDVSVQDVVGGTPSSISCLTPLPGVHRVAVALSSGRLFLVTSLRPVHEGSFVCTELGTATKLNACVAVRTPAAIELWSGGDTLSAYAITSEGVTAADDILVTGTVSLLAASEGSVVAYCEPGTQLYQYSVATKELCAKLDVSKLAPCSESLNSIALDDIQDHHVTSLCFVSSQLIAGTSNGVLIVTDAALRPLTVFRPYERLCCVASAVRPLQPDQPPMLITVGTNYRPLVPRYVITNSSTNSSTNASVSGTFCLLWNTRHWNEVL